MEEMNLKQLLVFVVTLITILTLGGCTNKDTPHNSSTLLPTSSPSNAITENTPVETPMPEPTIVVTETSAPNSKEIHIDITTENTTINGKDCILQATVIDLNGDGIGERITVYFTDESTITVDGEPPTGYYDSCEIIVTNPDGGLYTSTWSYDNMKPQLNFADFDTSDSFIQFYLEGNGPSGDPFTQIFSFNGSQIVKNTGFPGYLTSYDGFGRIYTYDIYNVNSYYDLTNGLTPLPKDNIVGTEIQRDFNILLCTNPGKGYTAAILSYYYEDSLEDYITGFKEEFICLVPANVPLVVLDIEFQTDPWDNNSDELYPVPWIKVRTPDGTEGWFCVFYGD